MVLVKLAPFSGYAALTLEVLQYLVDPTLTKKDA